jgi:hypothetical protein
MPEQGQSMRPLPPQLPHLSLVLGSVPLPEQTGQVSNPNSRRSMIVIFIAIPFVDV